MANHALVRQHQSLALGTNPDTWILDGRKMARRDPQGVFEAIDGKHTAEGSALEAVGQQLKATGQIQLERRNELNQALQAMQFDAGRHLSEIAQAKVDLVWAIGLFILNAALASIVLFGLGPTLITVLLSILVLATAVPVEEFFVALERKDALREGIFLTLSIIGLAATFWLGGLRGLFLGSFANAESGPANELLKNAARILQFSLAALTVVSEFLCGYKFYRWRTQWHSAAAQTVRERDRCNERVVQLHGAVKANEVEADVRREYRVIGAKQELAYQQPAPDPSRHLKQAVMGAVIALIVLALLFFLVPKASAAAVAPQPVVVLVDLTASTAPDSFRANMRAVSSVIKTLSGGQRILVLGITDSFGHPRILLDRQLPEVRSYFELELRAAQERLVAQWDRISATLRPEYKQTDVVGTLSLLTHMGELLNTPIHLIVFSDLRQSTDVDLERPSQINARLSLERIRHGPGIPRLAGADVCLLGVEPNQKRPTYFRELREFWTSFFSAAGAHVRVFSIDRTVPSFEADR